MTEKFVKSTTAGAKLVIMEGDRLFTFPLDTHTEWPLVRASSMAKTLTSRIR